jgi:F0F1-type ATP synthase assembly protein I
MPPDEKRSAARGYGQGYAYFAMALNFVAAILLFGAVGWVVDGRLGTRPLVAVLGAFVGGFAAFMRIYYRVKADTDAEKREGGRGRGEG